MRLGTTHMTLLKEGCTNNSQRCQVKVPVSKGIRVTILHCGSEEAWVPNSLKLLAKNLAECSIDYHKNMSKPLFEDWFNNVLLLNINPTSVTFEASRKNSNKVL